MASAPLPANDDLNPLVNIQLECDLLGAVMASNEIFESIADIATPNDFSEPLFSRVFETISHLIAQGKPASPVTLRGYFTDDPAMEALGGPSFLARLTGETTFGFMAPVELATHLVELAGRRRMQEGLQAAARYCSDLDTSTSEIVSLADAAVAPTGQSSIRQATAAECLGDLLDGLDKPAMGVLCRQIPSFDELHGPLEPSQLIILAARPGMGKTALAISYGLGASLQGHGVLFASLEMNRQQLAGRMAADLCFDGQAVPYAPIRDRRLNDFQRKRVADAYHRMQSVPLHIIDAGSLTPGRLSMLARRHDRRMRAKGHKLELIVVDYLQLMRPDSGAAKPYEAVSEVSRALKALAKDMDIPVLALAQLSREVERRSDRRPQLSDLRDSGQIEQDADSVMFLLRDEYYLAQAEPGPMDTKRAEWEQTMARVKGRIEFILAKRRNGLTGTATGEFHGAYQAVRG